jgi:2,5-diketo-D-gluconate reductase B
LTGDEGRDVITTALEVGYRHIDTAQMYGNEAAVGEGIRRADVPREDVFVATKINHRDIPAATREEVFEAVERSRDRLGLETIDLLYIHWPVGDYDPEETLSALAELREGGQIDHVGLSNCTPEILDASLDALDDLGVPLTAHQVEMHPLLQQRELHGRAVEEGHTLVAYSPLSHGDVFDVPAIRSVADEHGASEAQVTLAWHLSKENVAAVPKASSETHLAENLAAADLNISDGVLDRIDAIDREERFIDPDDAPWNE